MSPEAALVQRVLDALLREGRLGTGAVVDGWWRGRTPTGRAVAVPVRRDGFLHDHAVAEPVLVADGVARRDLAGVLDALAPAASDGDARVGWADFAVECAAALDTARGDPPTPVPTGLPGFAGHLELDALAALREHPVHPTGRARPGIDAADRRRYAPEFRPAFTLRWADVPRPLARVSRSLAADPPGWWPRPGRDTVAVPVHPLTGGYVTRGGGPLVVPTLSMRTVALVDDPATHVKLPLPTATLGRRNRRSIVPGTLPDGARVQRLLAAVLLREPALAATVLLADESRWVDTPDDTLAALIRGHPPELAGERLVPLAALAVPDPRTPGATVLDGLAGGDVTGWFARYVAVLLEFHVALWVRYGVALEAHQQNVTLVGDAPRLLYRDNDGARVEAARLAAALGVAPPVFHDARMSVVDPGELADVFVTITLHLCVAAPVLAVGDAGVRDAVFALVRDLLRDAAERWCDRRDAGSVAAAGRLRALLDAPRWPVKAMVTAGTLLPKHRLGATDVNKYYVRTGPNYLRAS